MAITSFSGSNRAAKSSGSTVLWGIRRHAKIPWAYGRKMSTNAQSVTLGTSFARELPELAEPWHAPANLAPHLIIGNEKLARELGLDSDFLWSAAGVNFLTGLALPDHAEPVAQAYAGHQFGSYVPRLGDGRAVLLGELTDPSGRVWDLHLKGSGRTRFSRGGDGQAALGPMLREHLVSEAMNALGIPTTRSLAVVATGREVQRETVLPGALLTRVATSHIRVGNFQFARASDNLDLLRRLADFAIARHYPDLHLSPNPYLALLEAVTSAQASLIAQWMLVGFVHGVMNTDNTTISGETIDYGPCAFMDSYDPATVFSSIDAAGRYSYGNQPGIAQWNLARFAETLLPLIGDDQDQAISAATAILEDFPTQYTAAWRSGMRRKLGLSSQILDDEAPAVIDPLLPMLARAEVDYTSFFRALSRAARGDMTAIGALPAVPNEFADWIEVWLRLSPDAEAMDQANPVYIPRNHLVEEALAAADLGDLGPFHHLLGLVTAPYIEQSGQERFAQPASEGFGPFVTYCGT